ncbi:MAG: anthranilate synthase component I family protein [Thermoplasmata archaeon]
MNNIYRSLADLTSDYENFAYFCKYDRNTRTKGVERLYLSNSDPVFIHERMLDPLSRIRESFMGKSCESVETEFPVVYSYDYVDSLFPDLGISRSDWPSVMAILPEKVIDGTHERTDLMEFVPGSYPPDRDQEMKIADAIRRIRSGDLLQVVLSERFPMNETDLFRSLDHMSRFDRSLYVFYFKFGKYSIVGSSPENLVTVRNRMVEIFPIAGTRPRGETPEEDLMLEDDLLKDGKELLEHRMLVDLARNDIGKIAVAGSVKVTKSMQVQKFATVQHIVSRVEGQLGPGIDMDDIVNSVFPAGTVSGAPKKRAMELINGYENHPRGPYSGSLGIAGRNHVDLALTIRSIFSNGSETFTQAGAGIVKDSVPVNEVMEMRRKASTVFGGVGIESSAHKQL